MYYTSAREVYYGNYAVNWKKFAFTVISLNF